jgi:uncharacterized protein (TIGR03067 family)
MRIRVLLTVVSVALLGFAPAPFPKTERLRHDPNDVSGTWEYVRCENGGSVDPLANADYRLEMTKEQFTFVYKGNSRTAYVMRLYPGASPPAFTWSQNNRVMYVGSYRMQNGQLTMIFNSGNSVEQRPTDFQGRAGWRYDMRRVGR